MTFGPVQDLVDALADRLGRSVVVEDHTLQLVAYSKHYGDADTARVFSLLDRRSRPDDVYYARLRTAERPTRVEENLELELYARLAVPIRYDGMLLGFIWLIDRHHTLTDSEIADSVDCGDQLARFLYRRLVVRDNDDALMGDLIARAIGGDDTERSAAVAELLTRGYIDDDSFIAIITARLDDTVDDPSILPAAVQTACRPLTPRTWVSRAATREATIIVAQPRPPTVLIRSVTSALEAALRAREHRFHIGVSGVRQGLADAAPCARQAEVAIRVTVGRDADAAVGFFDDLGAYRLIGQLPRSLVTNALLPHGIFQLLRSDDAGRLLSTAEMFLDCGGDKQEASVRLGIHRSTMYYRLDRIAGITALDLDDGNDRLLLHLAIKLWRMDTELPAGNYPAGKSADTEQP